MPLNWIVKTISTFMESQSLLSCNRNKLLADALRNWWDIDFTNTITTFQRLDFLPSSGKKKEDRSPICWAPGRASLAETSSIGSPTDGIRELVLTLPKQLNRIQPPKHCNFYS
jgi:hypothetical protein